VLAAARCLRPAPTLRVASQLASANSRASRGYEERIAGVPFLESRSAARCALSVADEACMVRFRWVPAPQRRGQASRRSLPRRCTLAQPAFAGSRRTGSGRFRCRGALQLRVAAQRLFGKARVRSGDACAPAWWSRASGALVRERRTLLRNNSCAREATCFATLSTPSAHRDRQDLAVPRRAPTPENATHRRLWNRGRCSRCIRDLASHAPVRRACRGPRRHSGHGAAVGRRAPKLIGVEPGTLAASVSRGPGRAPSTPASWCFGRPFATADQAMPDPAFASDVPVWCPAAELR
jgi:hypothetical protein